MAETTDLLSHAFEKNPVDFADTFNQLMHQRVQDAVEAHRITIAQAVYGEDEADEDSDEVDVNNDDQYDISDDELDISDDDLEDLDLDDLDLDDLDLDGNEDFTDEDA